MSDEIIERLRDPLDCPGTKRVFDLCREAADEIERLEIENVKLTNYMHRVQGAVKAFEQCQTK